MATARKEFEPDVNYVKGRLRHYFNFDHLSSRQGIAILIGVEPKIEVLEYIFNSNTNPCNDSLYCAGIRLLNGDTIGGIEFQEDDVETYCYFDSPEEYQSELLAARLEFWPFVDSHLQYLQYWNSGRHPEITPLAYFIEWAQSKNFRPEWLTQAIMLGLYTPKQEAAPPAQIVTEPAYSTAWMNIQQSSIAKFFNPRRNPDAKKEEVVEWIKSAALAAGLPDSQNIASTIFTIIKPENHDPKKKRVEPQ